MDGWTGIGSRLWSEIGRTLVNAGSRSTGKLLALTLVYLALFGGQTWFTWNAFSRNHPSANDFFPRWAGGCRLLWEGENPYSEETTLRIQRGMYGRTARHGEDQAAFAYPLYTLALTWPTCLIRDYAWVQAAWMTLLVHLLVLGTALTQRITNWSPTKWLWMGAMVWSIFVYPNARAVILGQLSIVVFVILMLSLWSLTKGKEVLSGALLGLTTIKPQMMLLTIPWLLLWSGFKGKRRVLWGFAGTIIGLVGAGLVLVPSWPLDFVEQLQAYTSYTELGSAIWIMTTYYLGTPKWVEWSLSGAVLLTLFGLWWRSKEVDQQRMLWLTGVTLLITHFVSPRTATTHFVVFLLPLFLVFEVWRDRSPARARWWIILILAVTLVGSWALFLATVQGDKESALNYLPIPIALMAALWSLRVKWLPSSWNLR